MNYARTIINFRDVVAGDSFSQSLTIADVFPLNEDTSIELTVRPSGDFSVTPVLNFKTNNASITQNGQTITLQKTASEMNIQPGTYYYQCQFSKDDTVTTLFGGIFEIVRDKTTY